LGRFASPITSGILEGGVSDNTLFGMSESIIPHQAKFLDMSIGANVGMETRVFIFGPEDVRKSDPRGCLSDLKKVTLSPSKESYRIIKCVKVKSSLVHLVLGATI
jgi:hypothetical protein